MSSDLEESVARKGSENGTLKGSENGTAYCLFKPVCDDVIDLWKFADTNNKSHHTIQDEEIVPVSSSSMIEDRDPKKKSPMIEGEAPRARASYRKAKMDWTKSLEDRFMEAIRRLGPEKAVPRKILKVMNIEGLTRENVASHLQKYRIDQRRKLSDERHKLQNSADHLNHSGRKLGMTSSRTRGSSLSLRSSQPPVLKHHNFAMDQYIPSLLGSSPLMGRTSLLGSPSSSLVNLNFNGKPSIKLSPSSFDPTLMRPTTINTTTYGNSSFPPPNILAPSNYVGYSMSNLKNLLGEVSEPFQGKDAVVQPSTNGGYTNIAGTCVNPFLIGDDINLAGGQLPDVVRNYRVMQPLPNPFPPFANSKQQLDQGAFHNTFEDQSSILNQPLNGGGPISTSSSHGHTSYWDHINLQSFYQNLITRPHEVGTNSSTQINNTIPPTPASEHEEEEFLNSLFASYGDGDEDTFDGV